MGHAGVSSDLELVDDAAANDVRVDDLVDVAPPRGALTA